MEHAIATHLWLGTTARDESRYSVMYGVLPGGVAGFNLRCFPKQKKQILAKETDPNAAFATIGQRRVINPATPIFKRFGEAYPPLVIISVLLYDKIIVGGLFCPISCMRVFLLFDFGED